MHFFFLDAYALTVFMFRSLMQPATPLTPDRHSSLTLPSPSLLFHFQRLPPFSPSFGPPLRFIARGRPTAEKPPCMERSVISTLSSKHTAFHIVLQGLGQIAIFMGHDKGNAALCSHFLLPGVTAGHAVIHHIGNCRGLSSGCCYVAERETTSRSIVVKLSNVWAARKRRFGRSSNRVSDNNEPVSLARLV